MTTKKAVNFPSPGRVLRSTTDLLYGKLTYSSHLRNGSMRVTSDYHDGASGDNVLPIWSLGMHARSIISKVTAATSPGREKWKYSLQVILRRLWPPELHLFLQPFPYQCPACCLTQDGITPAGVLTQPGPSRSLFSQHFSYHIKRSLRTWTCHCMCLLVLALQGPMYRGSRQKSGHRSVGTKVN